MYFIHPPTVVAYLGPSWLRSVEYKSNIVEKSKSRMVCIYSICRRPSESRKWGWVKHRGRESRDLRTDMFRLSLGKAQPQLTYAIKFVQYILIKSYQPIPWVQHRPLRKTPFKARDERHKVPIGLSFQTFPTGNSQASTFKTGNHWFPVDFELIGMVGELVDQRSMVFHWSRAFYRGEIQRNKYLQVSSK